MNTGARQIALGATLAILLGYSAVLTLGYGLLGISGSSIVTGSLLLVLPIAIFLLSFRRQTFRIQTADVIFAGLLLVALLSFLINSETGGSGSRKEYLLLLTTFAGYLACRFITIEDINSMRPAFERMTAAIVFLGAIFTFAELVRQWDGPPGKPFVFGFPAAGTYFMGALSFLIISLVATDRPTRLRSALISALIFFPTAIFAAAVVRFTFIALLGSLCVATVFTEAGKRWHVVAVSLAIFVAVALGLGARSSTTQVYAAYVLESPVELKSSAEISVTNTPAIVMPSCNLRVNMRNSIAIRQALIRDAVYLVPLVGFVGTGLDSFLSFTCIKAHQVHVSLFQMTVEFGWLGGILFSVLIGLATYQLIPWARSDARIRFVLCALVFAVSMSFAHGRISRDGALFALLGCALGVGSQRGALDNYSTRNLLLVQLTKRQRWAIGAIAALACFIAAYWKISYVPIALNPRESDIADAKNVREPDVAGIKVMLQPPFQEFMDSRFAVISNDISFSSNADTADNTTRSNIVIYEDDKPLGPAHSTHADVGNIGLGRFSHWRFTSTMFLFSSSDNTDPRTNGRTYWAVKPPLVQGEVPR